MLLGMTLARVLLRGVLLVQLGWAAGVAVLIAEPQILLEDRSLELRVAELQVEVHELLTGLDTLKTQPQPSAAPAATGARARTTPIVAAGALPEGHIDLPSDSDSNVATLDMRAVDAIEPASHLVAAGDTLEDIALRYDTTAEAIATLNGIADPSALQAGWLLQLP